MEYKITLSEHEDELLSKYMYDNNIQYKAEACRRLIALGELNEINQEQLDLIAGVVKEEMDSVMDNHSSRIKSIVFKGTQLAITSAFFLIGLLRDMVPSTRRKNVETLYEEASKYAVNHLRGN